nr:hypothetical protein GCM10020093_095080 [Planobispora longispora]
MDTGRSYIMGTIADAVFAEVKEAAGRTAIKDYWDGVFVSFGELHDATATAAEGARELSDGNRTAHDSTARLGEGADGLSTGLGQARDGTRRLTVGLGDATTATGKLSSGAKTLDEGLGDADAAAAKLSSGAKTLDEGLGDAESGSRKLGRGWPRSRPGPAGSPRATPGPTSRSTPRWRRSTGWPTSSSRFWRRTARGCGRSRRPSRKAPTWWRRARA